MVSQVPETKLRKARTMIQGDYKCRSLSFLNIQNITGSLNFVSNMVPLWRAFLRCLFNMQQYFPLQAARHRKRLISREAHKDIAWWTNALQYPPDQSIAATLREVICAWSDAASTKGLGGFYLDKSHADPEQGCVFIIPMLQSLAMGKEHINTQEMRAVVQVLLHLGRLWRGKSLLIHVDNKAVAHGISNSTICGTSMLVLRRSVLLASEYDLDLEANWIPTTENALADAHPRSEYNKGADLAPQLLLPTCDLLDLGFLTNANWDCHRQRLTTTGAGSSHRPGATMTPQQVVLQLSAYCRSTDTNMGDVFPQRQPGLLTRYAL